MEENSRAIQTYSALNYEQMIREPEGQLPYSFIVPGSATYNDCLWDWDSWLGPVWGVSNYLCFRGLVRYGFDKEAADLAEKIIRLFGRDLRRTGQMHEYYDPDTGEGVMNPGFQNWNLLANNMIAWLEGGNVVTEF